MRSLDKRFSLTEAEGRFQKACDQIVLLNHRLGEVQKRYKMAKRSNNKAFRYNLRLKLAVIEGVRNMYYDFAYSKADRVAELRRELFDESVEIRFSLTEAEGRFQKACDQIVLLNHRLGEVQKRYKMAKRSNNKAFRYKSATEACCHRRCAQHRFSLTEAEGRFQKACDQIVLLNHRLGEVQKRYKMAKRSNNKAFRYNLRLKLAVIEGVRNMYYDFAYSKADRVAELRRELFDESVEIRFSLTEAEGRFQKACDQIVLLNHRLGEVQKRYKMAKRSNNKAFRYNLRLKLAVIEGVRNMYYDFAYSKADRVAELRRELFDESVEIRFSLTEAEGRFQKACDQIVLLNHRLGEVQKRYKMAKRSNNKAFRYNLRLKLAVIEGVRNMYYDFAYSKADRVAELRRELFDESVEIRFSLTEAEGRFQKACDQIVLLNHRLGEVQKRYKMAKRSNNKAFRYNLRLKLAVIEGVRNMYYDFAYSKADRVAELRRELFDESVEIRFSLTEAEGRFQKACDQIVLLNHRLGEVQKRYKMAKRSNNKAFRYNLRLKLAVIEGVRNMYYDFAYSKADRVAELRRELFDESVEIRFSLTEAEGRFQKACDQIVLLNHRLGEVQKRYKMAKRSNNKAFRYNLRLKLAVIEGVRNMYYDFAYSKADRVAELRRELFDESVEIRFSLTEAEGRFQKACDQIVLLNHRLGEVQKRYKMAKRSNNKAFRYNLRLKLAVIEGVRNMYYDFAYSKADRVAELRRELFDESVEIKACDQIVLLNHRLGEVQKRYKMAKRSNNKAFRYNLRLKLAVIEGVRNMYYDFAYSKADRVAELRRELFDESVEIVSGSDSEYSSDDLE
ncbi:hypothetical protein MAR_017187 [Mya arenaria]|uniref:Uncharacterized protein n=1 Tax=Mya arenaria TaxID=6604 RepID=A0ABY7EDJ3_MYAAR|nr:hypothetical protein MAR_017187 [Mya arenaria]